MKCGEEMFGKNNAVIRFNENSLDLVILSKRIKTQNFIHNNLDEDDENIKTEIQKYIKMYNVSMRNIDVILNLNGIITRLIELPLLNKKQLGSFIKNNMEEYFTVNLDEYHFDYKIISIIKTEVKKMSILLVAFPKVKLQGIIKYLQFINVKPKKITVYPDSIAEFFQKNKREDIVIIDGSMSKCNITILENGGVFIFTNVINEGNDEKISSLEIIENMEYFLNFYATRHFGNRLQKVNVVGSLSENIEFSRAIEEALNVVVLKTKKSVRNNEYSCLDAMGCKTRSKQIYSKSINLNGNLALSDKGIQAIDETMKNNIAIGFIILLSLFWNAGNIAYLKYEEIRLDKYKNSTYINSKNELDKQLEALKKEKLQNDNLIKNLSKVEENKFSYLDYIKKIKNGLPDGADISNITVQKDKIAMKISIKKSTLEKIKLINAINDLNFFDKSELDKIKLDDSENEHNFDLKVKKPY